MAKVLLENGRVFSIHNQHIIKTLEAADESICDIEELFLFQKKSDNEFNHKSKSSSVIGSIGENFVQDELTHLNIAWHDTSKTPHCADIEFHLDGKRIFLDVKNYSKPVPSHEMEKLYRDCYENNIEYCMLFSLKSSISKKKSFEIEERNNVKMICVSLSSQYDLKTSVNILSAIIKIDKSNEKNFINSDLIYQCVSRISEQSSCFAQTKTKITELDEYTHKTCRELLQTLSTYEKNIQTIVNEIHNELSLNTICETSFDNFPHTQWQFIANDLVELKDEISFTDNMNKMYLSTKNITITFQKKKVLVACNSEKCTYIVENEVDWIKTKLKI